MLATATVRAALKTLLLGLPLTGARVHEGRYRALAESELPAWLVFIDGNEIELDTIHYPADELNTMSLSAELKLRSVDQLEADMDAGELQARQALFAQAPPYELRLIAIERSPQREGEAAAGTLRLRLEASFVTQQGDPETIL